MQSRKETGNVWQKRERSDATRATYSLISIRIVRDVRSGGSGSSLETVSKSTVLYYSHSQTCDGKARKAYLLYCRVK